MEIIQRYKNSKYIPRFIREFDAKTLKPIVVVAAFAFVYLFAYTAHAKFVGHAKFARVLHKSPLIWEGLAEPLAWAIPGMEALLALLLVFPPTMKKALWPAIGLMCTFTTYLIIMLASGFKHTCQCGGVIDKMGWAQHITFNCFFIILALLAQYWDTVCRFVKRPIQRINRFWKYRFML